MTWSCSVLAHSEHVEKEVFTVEVVGALSGNMICTFRNIPISSNVGVVAACIEQQEGTPRQQQRLMLSGRRIWDHESLGLLSSEWRTKYRNDIKVCKVQLILVRLSAEVGRLHAGLICGSLMLSDIPQEHQDDKDFLLSAVYGGGFSILPPSLMNDVDFLVNVLFATRDWIDSRQIFNHIPQSLLCDQSGVLKMLPASDLVLGLVPFPMLADRHFALQAAKKTQGKALACPLLLWAQDRAFVSQAVYATSGESLRYAPDRFRHDDGLKRDQRRAACLTRSQTHLRGKKAMHSTANFAPLSRPTEREWQGKQTHQCK